MKKVLFVEDEGAIRGMAGRLFKAYFPDCKLDLAKDGIEALECFNRTLYDVIFSDVRMPRMNGISFKKVLDEKGFRGKFVFMTGTSRDIQGMGVGYVEKPFRIDDLKKYLV